MSHLAPLGGVPNLKEGKIVEKKIGEEFKQVINCSKLFIDASLNKNGRPLYNNTTRAIKNRLNKVKTFTIWTSLV